MDAALHTMAARAPDARGTGRLVTLDIVRGVAVMGILAMNIVAFAMPPQAYFNPHAYGWWSDADLVSWVFSFVFIDGRMRGLFSFLFGASMLLVIDRGRAAGESPARIHFARMGWLLLFGLFHHFFIWWGDILALYAPVGMVAWFFRRRTALELTIAGIIAIIVQLVLFAAIALEAQQVALAAAAPGASASAIEAWRNMSGDMAVPTAAELSQNLALYRSDYWTIVSHRIGEELWEPVIGFVAFGAETIGYMLLGMATLRSGFLTGEWSDRSYARVAIAGFGLGIPAYAALAWALVNADFAVPSIFMLSMAATTAVRPFVVIGLAALIILATRRGGKFVEHIAAAGRAAFTNYLGTSILMTLLFYGYGFGLYGRLSRAELWLVVIPAWALMLLWSKPWLDRYRYGPFEWLWRSLARWQLQPMRKAPADSLATG
jgi:uncharacterized protein